MTPEQQAEFRRREDRKGYATGMASNALIALIQADPEASAGELATRAWDIGEAMARERSERGHEH